MLSMFVRPLWGFKQKKPQTVAGYIACVWLSSVVAVLGVTVLVLGWGDGTARTWAWIDVVRLCSSLERLGKVMANVREGEHDGLG